MSMGHRYSLRISLGIVILIVSTLALASLVDKNTKTDHSAAFNRQERKVFDTGLPAGMERPGARGNGSYWSAIETVSTESDMGSDWCVVVVDSGNTLHVVWEDETDYNSCGSDWDIFYKNKPDGGAWSMTEVVSTESWADSWYPQMAVESDGTVHVAWYDNVDGIYTVSYKKRSDGGSWTTTEVVYTGAYNQTLAVGQDSAIHVAFEDQTSHNIYYKKKPYGGSWAAAEMVNTESIGSSCYPSLAVVPNNTVHIAWSDYADYSASGSDLDIFYKTKDVVFGWTGTEVVSTDSDLNSFLPDLVVDSDETVHVVWYDAGDNKIFYKNKPVSDTWSTLEYAATLGPYAEGTKSLAAGDDGTVHFVWDDEIDYGMGSGDTTILSRKKLIGGGWTTSEEVSEESPDYSLYPSVAVDSRGIVHVVWSDGTNDYNGSGSDWDIFYRKKIPFESIYVDDDNTLGPWDGTIVHPYQHIQVGIDAAADGMTVMVADGTYSGPGNQDLHFDGKAITLRSKSGPYACVIDISSSTARGFNFASGEDGNSVLMGFTIRNANSHLSLDGAAIYCDWASPTIVNNIFRNNETFGDGGAIACHNSYPLIKNNLFIGNSALRGGAVYFYFVGPTLINNTLVGNSAVSEGGGIFADECVAGGDIMNTILWGNTAPSGAQIGLGGFSTVSVTYCDIQGGYSGTGNINADPIFVSGPLGGYYLSQIAAGQASTSPCVDTGSGPALLPCIENPLSSLVCGTTRTDLEPDTGILDMGYHYPDAGISSSPGSGLKEPPGDSAKFRRMD